MIIHMSKLYKLDIIFSTTFALVIIIGALVFTFYYYTGSGVEDYIMLFCAIPMATGALTPIIISHRHLTQVHLDKNGCVAYSFLRKKLCMVDFRKPVYYSFFYFFSKIPHAPRVEFIAVSNERFAIPDKSTRKKGFYGAYDQRKIIIFLYEEKVSELLNIEKWEQI